MLRAKKIQKSYGSLTVISDASFALAKGQKVALVGDNGTGKTTILKIIAGLVEPDSGELEIQKNTCIGYLPQDTSLVSESTIRSYLRQVSGITAIEQELSFLVEKLENKPDTLRYGELQEQYERLGGYSFDHRIEVMLAGFGLENVNPESSLSILSSGQKSKVVLAGILLKGVDLLLLDEPTNNLDLPALIWLEDFIKKSDATCVIVSHDRQFLDRVVRKILELDRETRTLTISGGSYSDYLEMTAKRLARQKEAYLRQQEEIDRLSEQAQQKRAEAASGAMWMGTDNDKFLRGFKRNRAGKSSRMAKNIEKRIDQMDKIEKPIDRDLFEIPLNAEVNNGTLDIKLTDVVTGYPGSFVIGPLSLEARFGSRIGIMGLNGSGKSTLLKTLTGFLTPQSGKIEIGSGIRIGNMMQEHETLPREVTPLELFEKRTKLDLSHRYNQLAKFGFNEIQVKQPISALSPGGRARLLLAIFSAQSVNTLILDEPTNHLDLEALDALEETLKTYKGTILLVSHDRYFLEKARLDSTYILSDGNLSRIPDYKVYVGEAEERAKKLLKSL